MMSLVQRALLLLSLCFVNDVFCQPASHAGYSRERYPNPAKEVLYCRTEWVEKTSVCDPDRILDSQKREAEQLDALIAKINNETACPCSRYSCEHHRGGYKIGIALIQKMQFDPDNRLEEDYNDVGETNKRRIVRNLHQAQLYAHDIQKRWKLGHCDEDVIIFYSRDDNVVYTSTGDVAQHKLTNELIASIAREARHMGFHQSSFDGLKKLVNDYRLVFLNGYHPRKPTAEEYRSDVGLQWMKGQTSVIITCAVFMLGYIMMQ